MEELISICEKYVAAREQYENAARAQVRNASLLHDKTLFWKMVEDLRESVIAFINRDDAVRSGCLEFVRKTFAEGGQGYSGEDLPDFIRTYGKLKDTLFGKIAFVEDALRGDLADALPLAGQMLCLKVILETPEDKAKLDKSVIEACVNRDSLAHAILLKENRVEQSLEDAYCDKLCEFVTGKGSLSTGENNEQETHN